MARGWESKSVEAQMEAAAEAPAERKPVLTPERAAQLRRREGLMLSRKHVAQQLQSSHSARHRQMLEQALAALDAQLANPD
jgi:hypothetical protein